MWVRDIDGRLINMAHIVSVTITPVPGGEYEVRVWEAGDSGDCWTLCYGSGEECERYLAGLDGRLGIVDRPAADAMPTPYSPRRHWRPSGISRPGRPITTGAL